MSAQMKVVVAGVILGGLGYAGYQYCCKKGKDSLGVKQIKSGKDTIGKDVKSVVDHKIETKHSVDNKIKGKETVDKIVDEVKDQSKSVKKNVDK